MHIHRKLSIIIATFQEVYFNKKVPMYVSLSSSIKFFYSFYTDIDESIRGKHIPLTAA